MKPNTDSIVAAIRDAAKRMRDGSDELDRYAARLAEGGPMDNVAWAINSVTNTVNNLGLDRITSRTIDSYIMAETKAEIARRGGAGMV